MSNELSIQDRIDIVKGKVESLVQTGIAPADLIYCPAEWKDLTVQQFSELVKAVPGTVLSERSSYYAAHTRIAGIYITIESALGTRKPAVSKLQEELNALTA